MAYKTATRYTQKNTMTFEKILLFLIIGSLICCTKSKSSKTSTTPPNVILIVVDDLGWKDLGFMGSDYYETPNLDAFIKEGMVFNQAYASAANCAPSRACMLSGMQSPRHGVYTVNSSARGKSETRRIIPTENTKYLNNDLFTLPDLFKSAGYVTGSFGKWHVGKDPTKQGIDVNIGGSERGSPGKGGYFSPYKIDNIENVTKGEYLTNRLTDEAIQFVNSNQQKPFFLYLPYYTVHTPIMANEEFLPKFEGKKGSNGQSNPAYATMVYAMDQNIGRLLNHLENLELDENTLVIFTSDNGGVRSISNQAPLRAGKGSYYEGGIRVPLAVRWPNKIKAGTSCNTRVTNLDFYPTLQNIIKAQPVSFALDGTDISPLFYGQQIEERDLVWHFPIYLNSYRPKVDDGRDPLFRTRPGTVLISGNWKLHEYFEDQSLELYDLSADIGERNNLADSNPEKTKTLHEKMKLWRARMNAPVPSELNPDYDAEFEKSLILRVTRNQQ